VPRAQSPVCGGDRRVLMLPMRPVHPKVRSTTYGRGSILNPFTSWERSATPSCHWRGSASNASRPLPLVGALRPDRLQPRKQQPQADEYQRRTIAVLNVGRLNHGIQDKPLAIDDARSPSRCPEDVVDRAARLPSSFRAGWTAALDDLPGGEPLSSSGRCSTSGQRCRTWPTVPLGPTSPCRSCR
jgi:hypothetical protein